MATNTLDRRLFSPVWLLITLWALLGLAEAAVVAWSGYVIHAIVMAQRSSDLFDACEDYYNSDQIYCQDFAEYYGNKYRDTLISNSVILAATIIILAIRLLQIFQFARNSLTPRANMRYDLIRLMFWTPICVWTIVAYCYGKTLDGLEIFLIPIMEAFYIASCIFASIINKRPVGLESASGVNTEVKV